MRKVPALGLIPAAIALLVTYLLHRSGSDVHEFYAKNMRASLFAGFLTLGGFLLSLKTFVVVKMKEGLYDNKTYRGRFKEQLQSRSKASLYDPLRNLSHLLYYSILSCISTSLLQMTLGLLASWWTASIGIAAAAFSISLLIFSLIQIKGNLDTWFECLDDEFKKAHDAEQKNNT